MLKQRLIIMVNVALLLLALWGISTVLSDTSLAAQDPDTAARQGLPELLRVASNMGLEKYGFKDKSEIASATVARPVEARILSPEAVRSFGPGKRVTALVDPEQWWEYPVMVNGQARGLLTVAQQKDQWQAVGFGALAVSQRLMDVQRALGNSESTAAVTGGGPITIVNVYPLHSRFAMIRRNDKESLVLLESYPGLFESIDKEVIKEYPAEELMPQIARAIDQMRLSGNSSGLKR